MGSEVDVTVLAAFAVGFVSFISPCVLPLVPGYLSAVSGVSLTDIREGERTLRGGFRPVVHGRLRRPGHDRHESRLGAPGRTRDARQGRRRRDHRARGLLPV